MRPVYSIFLMLALAIFAFELEARDFEAPPQDLDAIQSKIASFSKVYMNGELAILAKQYALNARIHPHDADNTQSRTTVQKRWELPEETDEMFHKVEPPEIRVKDDTIWEYGCHAVGSNNRSGTSNWKGKHMTIWKKIDGERLIYLDILNRLDI